MGSAALTRQTSVLGAIRAITGLNRSFNRPGKSLGSRRQPQREAGQGRGGAHHGQVAQVLAHLAPPLRGLQLQPLPGLLLAIGRGAAAVVAAVAGGRVEAGLKQLPPLPQLRIPTRTPGVSGPEGLGSPGGRASPKARPAPRPLGRPHSACSDERRRATGQAPEWGASDPHGNRPHPHPARLSLTGQPKPSRVT